MNEKKGEREVVERKKLLLKHLGILNKKKDPSRRSLQGVAK